MENQLEVQSLREFMSENNFVQVAKTTRANTNGYGYITFINGDNEAENIYFSKNTPVKPGTVINKELFATLQIAHTTNAAGEKRVKLCKKGSGNRVEATDLF